MDDGLEVVASAGIWILILFVLSGGCSLVLDGKEESKIQNKPDIKNVRVEEPRVRARRPINIQKIASGRQHI